MENWDQLNDNSEFTMRARPYVVIARLSDQEFEDLLKNCRFFCKKIPANKSERLRGLLAILTQQRRDSTFKAYVGAIPER